MIKAIKPQLTPAQRSDWFDAIEDRARDEERRRETSLIHGHGLMGQVGRPDKRGKRRDNFSRVTHRDWW